MSINGSNRLYTQWAGLIGNVNATADDRGDPFFRKAVSCLESLWKERVASQNDEASAALLSALAQTLMIYSTHRIGHEGICPPTAGSSPHLRKSVRFPRRSPL